MILTYAQDSRRATRIALIQIKAPTPPDRQFPGTHSEDAGPMMTTTTVTSGQQTQAVTLSTLAFTICFAVWTIFSIIGVQIKQELGLNET
jgi:hypothetical protein